MSRGSLRWASAILGRMLVLAHAAHWALWVLYAVPVIVVLAATGKAFLDAKREEREDSGS